MSKFKRFLVFLAVIGCALFFLWPTIRWYFMIPENEKALAMGSREQIREYALDFAAQDIRELKKLAVEKADEALADEYDFMVGAAKKANKEYGRKQPASWTAKTVLLSFENEKAALDAAEGYYRGKIMGVKDIRSDSIQLGLDLSGGMSVVIQANLDSVKERMGRELSDADREDSMNRALEILKSRIDTFGLTEPVIRRMGEDQIYVEIPGAADPERIKSIIMGKGRLAFHIVDADATNAVQAFLAQNPTAIDSAGNLLENQSIVPAGFVIRKYYERDKYGIDQFTGRYLVVDQNPGLDGNYVISAQVSSDSMTGSPTVAFKLSKEGADIFFQLTTANKGKQMAILLDDKVKNAATIQDAIRESGQISGLDSEEAESVSKLLRTAALPVELEVGSQQAIGASLGEDAIREGANALMWGILFVFAFMLIYYKGAGINAMIAQLLNLFLMIGILSAFNLTLTLPSVAGFVLTIGMSVDANVIIFERIKEELHLSKGRKASIAAGFNKAFWAIIDGNITTIIAALFLALLGSGPIQGFAVSLAIGNASSLFTALFVSKLIFDFGTDVFKSKSVSISWRVK